MLRVLLAQLPVPSSPALNTPLAAGYLKAFAEAQGLGSAALIELLPRALADHAGDAALVEAIVARRPDLLGLSLYTWNSERSLDIALRVKERLPGLVVLGGGPEVQADNGWLLAHPALDLAAIGEGEQTFAELIAALAGGRRPAPADLARIPGLVARLPDGALTLGPERVALSDLAAVPSPYLAGHLELPPAGMLMVEVSRWCPYSCGFCLYGRNLGPRLGSRYFGLERVLAEIAWGRARGVRQVHFVEANLNLVPIFWPLMSALAALNADRRLTFYAELRGEHLTDEVVAALDAANVRVVEVGLQTANPAALRAAYRRTDLQKWAAGTRRLYAREILVLLDVILGLPADDVAGVATTLAFLEREELGPHDIFTLQVLPATAVRREAARYALRHQERPPYYVLATDRLPYAELRRLRRELKVAAGLDPDAIEGAPPPRLDRPAEPAAAARRPGEERAGPAALGSDVPHVWLREAGELSLVEGVWFGCDAHAWSHPGGSPAGLAGCPAPGSGITPEQLPALARRLAAQVDVTLPAKLLGACGPALSAWIAANPTTIFDLYLLCDAAPPWPAALRAWREGLPFTPGYLDRVAVYSAPTPDPPYGRLSPRLFLVLPWVAQAEPTAYAGVAQIVWRYDAPRGEPLPLGAWRAAGGAGIWLCLDPAAPPAERAAQLAEARAWAGSAGRMVWATG